MVIGVHQAGLPNFFLKGFALFILKKLYLNRIKEFFLKKLYTIKIIFLDCAVDSLNLKIKIQNIFYKVIFII